MSPVSRRAFLRWGAGAGVGALLAACAPPAPPAEPTAQAEPSEAEPTAAPSTGREKVTLTVWMNDRLYVQSFQNRKQAFADAHPDYDFEFVIEENPDLWDNIITLFVGGLEEVDILAIERTQMSRLWKDNLADQRLVALNDLLTPEEFEGHMRWEMFTWNGKTYGVSAEMDGVAFYYRTDLFEEAGIDVDAIETYDDFIEAGRALRKLDKYIIYLASADVNFQLMNQNDGGYFSADGEVLIDSPETIEAVQLQYDMLRTHEVALETADVWSSGGQEGFRNGTVAACIEADWWSDYYLKAFVPELSGKWRLRKLPVFRAGGRPTASLGGTGHCISKSTPNLELALDFLRMTYIDKENLIQIFLDTHYFPPMKACWEDPRIREFTDEYYGGQATGAVWADLAPLTPLDPTHEFKPEAQDLTAKQVALAFEGEKTIEEALKEAADELRRLMG